MARRMSGEGVLNRLPTTGCTSEAPSGGRRPKPRGLVWKRAGVIALSAAAWLLPGPELGAQDSPSYKVIVHATNPVSTLTKRQVSDYFLKKRRPATWDHGPIVLPVDQEIRSDVRKKFSKEVVGRSAGLVDRYWQQRVFSGRGVPPDERQTDQQVMNYVKDRVGAIGYISADVTLIEGVKVLRIAP